MEKTSSKPGKWLYRYAIHHPLHRTFFQLSSWVVHEIYFIRKWIMCSIPYSLTLKHCLLWMKTNRVRTKFHYLDLLLFILNLKIISFDLLHLNLAVVPLLRMASTRLMFCKPNQSAHSLVWQISADNHW